MESGSFPAVTQTARYVRFGPFQIDQQRQQVYRAGSRLRLQGKVFQVLLVLIQKQGEVVSREELKQALWPADTHVNFDANVNTTVNKLRQALGESTEKPLYIETIPRKGYSFISTAEFSDVPFARSANELGSDSGAPAEESRLTSQESSKRTRRWITIAIVVLVLAGILIGAGAASFWILHFSPELRHSAHRPAPATAGHI